MEIWNTFYLDFNLKSLMSIASLMWLGTSGITLSMMTLIRRKICSKNTNIRIQSLLEALGAKSCTSRSMAKRLKLVMIEIKDVRVKAVYQAPISLIPLGGGFLKMRHSLYTSIFNSNKLWSKAKKAAKGYTEEKRNTWPNCSQNSK